MCFSCLFCDNPTCEGCIFEYARYDDDVEED